ncbi:hypothetical protein [Yoonia sediminilitoris]|uniref:Uncharacterized protein n=1 Tax=Yoonia sediminilitoris TaxID=1286148 RepID=A0A2T6KBF6_9RHOB|nr:hypothetical protein [Yoonia sediminilitoris]PUB12153.1 hypothetical protein C8N45_111130 [Yoonia sediminilitoris]RCW92980.1 hypothetical protein DFP92_111129 [Yoonia sediminilitoris]
MSNKSNTDEIDEVMSSVRKLVLKNDRTDDATANETPNPVQPPERFILTPSLRIEETASEEPSATAQVPTSDQTESADNILHLDPPPQTEELAGLDATLAELEAAVTKQPEDWEADEGETIDNEDWAVSAFAAPEATSFFEDTDSPDTSDGEEPIQADTTEDAVFAADGTFQPDDELKAFFPEGGSRIDQAALRELIVEIVHEELTGEVGERISRNVRKLVRREINQMLAARKLS